MTLEQALSLEAGAQLGAWDPSDPGAPSRPKVALGPAYPDFDSRHTTSQWRLPLLDLLTGGREYWPNGRFEELVPW